MAAMKGEVSLSLQHPEIGICGLSCRLCPSFHTQGASRCGGCKSEGRMAAGCPFITCAVKRKGLEFCWQCAEAETCARWRAHRAAGRERDSFVCYQRLEHNIAAIAQHGLAAFEAEQREREGLLREMLAEFDAGRSKRLYCVAATVLGIEALQGALALARAPCSAGLEVGERARALRQILESLAAEAGVTLRLRR